MSMSLAPHVIEKTQQYWKSLGIELDDERAEEIVRAYLELIDLVTIKEEKKEMVDDEAV